MAGKYDGAIYIETAIETDGFTAGSKDVEAAARRMAKKVSGIGATAKVALQKQTDAFVKQNQQLAQQKQKVESLENEFKKLSETQIETEEFAEIGKQIDSDTVKLNRLKKTQEEFLAVEGKTTSTAYQKREMQIEELQKSIQYAKLEQDRLLNSEQAYTTPDTSKVRQKLVAEQQKLMQMNTVLGTSYEALKVKVETYGGAIPKSVQYTNLLESVLLGLKKAAYAPVSSIKLLGNTILSLPKKIPGLLASGLKKLGSAAKYAATTIGKKLLSGLKRVGSSMLGLNKKANQTSFGLKQALKTMLLYGVLGNIFSSISNGAKEGMQNLAQYSSETNASISSLMSALMQLKNSFATAFAPILNVVAPVLTTFINLISKAVTYIGMLIAALTGKGTFTKAVGVQQDYAASLDKSASAAEGAKEASEDYLSGLDEVQKFDAKDSGGSGGSGGGGGVSPDEMFETVTIGDEFSNIAEKIKEAWRNADFTEIGTIVGDKINQALESVPWNQIQATVGRIARSIATFLNGAISGTDWSLVGNTIAQAFNTAFEFGYNFVTTFDWKKFGDSIADGINGFVKNLDAAKAAQGLSGFIKGLLDTCIRAINNTDWRMIGEKIREFLVNIDWTGIVKSLSTALGGALGGLSGVIVGVFSDLLTGFYEKYIEPYIPEVDASGINIIKGFLKGIGDAIADIGTWIYDNIFTPFIDGFKDAFDIHSPSVVMEEQGGYIIEGLLKGLEEKIGDVLDWFGKLPGKIKDVLGDAKKWLVDKGKGAIEGIKNGWEAVKDSKLLSQARKLKDDVFGAVGAIKEKVVSKGSDIIAGIKNGYENSKESGFLSKIRKIGSDTFSAIGGIKQTVKQKGSDIVSGLSEGYEDTKDVKLFSSLRKVGNQMLSSIGNVSQLVRTKGTDITSGLSDGLTGSFDRFLNIVKSIPGQVMNALGNLYSIGRNALQNFINGFTSIHIPTPHFSIGWEDVNVLGASFKLPKFRGINWYKKGGLFSSPSVIGVGEAGKEAVLPIQNRKVMNLLADSIVSSMGSRLSRMNVPYLASGAVIPPNAPFAAVLGDQKRGNNLEAPEKLLRQLLREELSRTSQKGGNYTFIGQINRRTLFEEMMTEAELVRSQTGMNPFEMA